MHSDHAAIVKPYDIDNLLEHINSSRYERPNFSQEGSQETAPQS